LLVGARPSFGGRCRAAGRTAGEGSEMGKGIVSRVVVGVLAVATALWVKEVRGA
jgi:hypothetical protein